jgi:hypothetical protein
LHRWRTPLTQEVINLQSTFNNPELPSGKIPSQEWFIGIDRALPETGAAAARPLISGGPPMNANQQLWPLAHEVLRALGQQYYPIMEARAHEAGIGQCDWYLLLPALTHDPEPISTTKLLKRVPYYAPHVYENRLENLSELGYLKASSPAEDVDDYPRFNYNLTESGRMTVQWIIQAADVAMLNLHPASLEDLEVLAGLLRMIVMAAVDAPIPPEKYALLFSRKTDHASVAPVVVRIDQYLTDLNAYRDDCHLCAWQEHHETQMVAPPAWEVLTQLWKVDRAKDGGGYTLDQLVNMLERRGHPRSAYASALKELGKLGWAQSQVHTYTITEPGRQAREMAEMRTDQYFYRPWNALSARELSDLKDLLVEVWDGLKIRINNGHLVS